MNPNTRSIQELELLFSISQILDGSLDIKEVVGPVLESTVSPLALQCATLTLLNRKTGEILIEASSGLSSEETRLGRYLLGEGITGQVVLTGDSIILAKTSDSPLFLNRTKRPRAKETSFVCVPIKVGKEIAGALSAEREFDPANKLEEDARILSIIASMIAQAVKLRRAIEESRDRLEEENERLRAELRDRFRPANIVGNSHEMRLVYDQIAQVSKSPATVLIEGETGTGKELVAHAIHYNSDRADKPFVRVHCAALSETVIESELFGHVKGAFTGAISERKGRFELAHAGTLFLDEVAEIPLGVQTKLLRVLQEREFERVGGNDTVKVNVRLLAATNRDLSAMVAAGEFREDLYYRFNVFPLYVPPLRKRKADIALLSDYFLEKYSREYGKNVRRLSSAVIDMLYAYHWPGNIRELENVIERAVTISREDVIHPHHLPPTLQTAEASGTITKGKLKDLVNLYEKDLIVDSLKSTRGNMAAAARNLETTERILAYKVHLYGIKPRRYSVIS